MSNRILVTYAGRTGSTAEVAKIISDLLTSRGFVISLKSVKEKPSIEGYRAVVLGSAIRMGGWLPEMLEFIRTNQMALNQTPTAIFTVHIFNTGTDPTGRAARKAYTLPVWKMLTPVHEAFFAGKMDPAKLSPADRVLSRLVAVDIGQKVGDFRDWDQIRGWSETIFS
jgi:menaquinone-dependent protoporphyrinogen oxidase